MARVIVQKATIVTTEATGRRRAALRESDVGDVSKRFSKNGEEIKDSRSVKQPETNIRNGVEIS